MLSGTYYAKNYAGIISQGLAGIAFFIAIFSISKSNLPSSILHAFWVLCTAGYVLQMNLCDIIYVFCKPM